jgi:hypothetical protein
VQVDFVAPHKLDVGQERACFDYTCDIALDDALATEHKLVRGEYHFV